VEMALIVRMGGYNIAYNGGAKAGAKNTYWFEYEGVAYQVYEGEAAVATHHIFELHREFEAYNRHQA
jgi:hypothetical protein